MNKLSKQLEHQCGNLKKKFIEKLLENFAENEKFFKIITSGETISAVS